MGSILDVADIIKKLNSNKELIQWFYGSNNLP